MSSDKKQCQDYDTYYKAEPNQSFLLVMFVDEGHIPQTALIDIPVAMQEEGLSRKTWEWLCGNSRSDTSTKGPGVCWLRGIREDTQSKAYRQFDEALVDSNVILLHVHASC
jgi:hypothetical protein